MYRLVTIDPSGFNDWADAQSGISIIDTNFVDASSLQVIYSQILFPTTKTTGSRVEDQPNGKGVGTNG